MMNAILYRLWTPELLNTRVFCCQQVRMINAHPPKDALRLVRVSVANCMVVLGGNLDHF